jgi:voltage-gated potassium channel
MADPIVGDRLTRFAMRRFMRALETGRILPSMIATIIALVFAFAAIMRVVDSEDFPTYGRALWWAAETVTTVGYGDVVPVQPVGRIVASLLMAAGFAFLALVTGTVASALVGRHQAHLENPPDVREALEAIERRLASIEERLDA